MKTDHELIASFITSQDKSAFAELVRRYQSGIRQFLRRLSGGDHALADDLAQETFIVMFSKLDTYKGNSALNTWLHKIAYNHFIGNKRKQGNREWLSDDSLIHLEAEDIDLVTDVTVEKLMKNLTVDERLTMTLHYSAGMSHSEIVEVTEMPLGTIKSNINRAKGKMSQWINDKKPNDVNQTLKSDSINQKESAA